MPEAPIEARSTPRGEHIDAQRRSASSKARGALVGVLLCAWCWRVPAVAAQAGSAFSSSVSAERGASSDAAQLRSSPGVLPARSELAGGHTARRAPAAPAGSSRLGRLLLAAATGATALGAGAWLFLRARRRRRATAIATEWLRPSTSVRPLAAPLEEADVEPPPESLREEEVPPSSRREPLPSHRVTSPALRMPPASERQWLSQRPPRGGKEPPG